MIIKKLELQGFKSFPDRTKIVFHPGITAVIGPNGTGKSNIVDALLWVLGGQRQKSLRGAKTEDIIFNGTQKRPALGMADVTVAFQNEQEDIVVNHRALPLGRERIQAERQNLPAQGHPGRALEAGRRGERVFRHRTGRDRPSPNLQADRKTSNSSRKRRARRSTRKRRDKPKASWKARSINLTRLEDIIAEVAKAKNSLQRQASAASRYRKLRERQRELTGLHFARKIQLLEKKRAESHSAYAGCLTQEKDLVSRLKQDERELTQKRTDLWDLERGLKESEERLRTLELQIRRAEMEKDSKRLDILDEKRKSAGISLKDLEADLVGLVLEIARAGESTAELHRALDAKRADLAEAEARMRGLEEAEAGWRKNLEELKTAHMERVFELTEARNEAGRVDKEIELHLRQEEKLQSQLSGEESFLSESDLGLNRIRERLDREVLGRDDKRRQIEDLNRSLQAAGEAIERLEARAAELKQKRDQDYYELQALKKLEQKERESGEQETVPGSLGILADLLEADPEYAPLLDVFWKEEARAAAVPAGDFLKNFSGGELRSRLLLLSGSRQALLPEAILQDPDVLGLLKAHVRPDSRIKDYLPQLQEAAIARDVLTAVRLWLRHPSLNVVTLGGDLLLASGLLKPGRKGEGIFALAAEIKKLEEKIHRADEEAAPVSADLDKLRAEERDSEDRLRVESAGLVVLERTIQDAEKEKALAEASREKALSNTVLFRKETELLFAEKQELVEKREKLAARISALESEERELKGRYEAEETKFSSEQDNLVRAAKSFVELRAAGDLLAEKIRNAEAGQAAVLQRKDAALTKSQALHDELLRLENEEAGLRQSILDLDLKAEELEAERRSRLAEIQDQELRRQGLHAEEMEREKTLNRLREEAEAKKDERVKWEVSKAEVDRDLVNLEETCWQELKKTLPKSKPKPRRSKCSTKKSRKSWPRATKNSRSSRPSTSWPRRNTSNRRSVTISSSSSGTTCAIPSRHQGSHPPDRRGEPEPQFLTALAEFNTNFQELFSRSSRAGRPRSSSSTRPIRSRAASRSSPSRPGKKVKNMGLLSGGEKSLTSLAFLFALFRYKPTPFCILDEVDAALDEANLVRFLDLMKKIKIDTQFIIITHNYKTMEVADYIYGTTMEEPNVTRLFSMKLEKEAGGDHKRHESPALRSARAAISPSAGRRARPCRPSACCTSAPSWRRRGSTSRSSRPTSSGWTGARSSARSAATSPTSSA